MRAILALSALALTLAVPLPAMAQSADEKVNMVIVYGKDVCPQSSPDEITVCARKDEGERYRIPPALRATTSRQDESWTSRVSAYETVGAQGIQSCSATGAGGWTGCEGQLIHNAYAEKKAAPDVQFSRLIEAQRQERLSKIDAQAARTQANVEAAEKDYDARQRAAQDPQTAPDNVPTAGVITGSGGK